jgi:hypothetical protein
MTAEEFKQGLKALEKEYRRKKKTLIDEFLASNHRYHVGDVLIDRYHNECILVQSITASQDGDDEPTIHYSGIVVDRNGEPNKDGRKQRVIEGYAVPLDKYLNFINQFGNHE